jgi:hypothetical protein
MFMINNIKHFSTSFIARKHGLVPTRLSKYLLDSGYTSKEKNKTELTGKGLGLGGQYVTYENGGIGIVWDENRLIEAINNLSIVIDINRPLGTMISNSKKRMPTDTEKREQLHAQLERGTKILETNEELDSYMSFFGDMHQQKMKIACSEIDQNIDVQEIMTDNDIQIIDYACGQGTAAIEFLGYIRNKNFHTDISKVVLIEPSKLSLNRAGRYFNGNIDKVNNTFSNLDLESLYTNPTSTKFHLFSNILDMGDSHFNINELAGKIIDSQQGVNYFICVSTRKEFLLAKFMGYFRNFQQISSLSGSFEYGNPLYKRSGEIVLNIFKVAL